MQMRSFAIYSTNLSDRRLPGIRKRLEFSKIGNCINIVRLWLGARAGYPFIRLQALGAGRYTLLSLAQFQTYEVSKTS